MVKVNESKILVGLLMGCTLLTTGCASDYFTGDVPAVETSVDIPVAAESGATGSGAGSTPTPPPPDLK